jgi:hypothetical protein
MSPARSDRRSFSSLCAAFRSQEFQGTLKAARTDRGNCNKKDVVCGTPVWEEPSVGGQGCKERMDLAARTDLACVDQDSRGQVTKTPAYPS